MKTKHTPGEWRMVSHLKKPMDLHIHVDGKSICEMPESYSNPDNENNANAKLIAAAPELLQKLQFVIDAWDDYIFSGDKNMVNSFVESAKKTILKATT